ncbi:MAG: hypothetical protein EOO00_09865 [Chitinophagaceae bacterium]|nr:MAG: hypothetical protein EOO00_09865 [Chitinophagaceae bacterium]
MVTLFLSQGVPMIYCGDEIGNSQCGNNNTYCQDSDISWVKWDSADKELHAFVKKLIAFRKTHPSFTRKRWFRGKPIRNTGIEDIAWFAPDGSRMDEENWNNGWAKSLGVFLNGSGLRCLDEFGEKMTDDNFYVVFNAHEEPVNFTIPAMKSGSEWRLVLNTADTADESHVFVPLEDINVAGRSIMVLSSKNFSLDKIPPESLPDITDKNG